MKLHMTDEAMRKKITSSAGDDCEVDSMARFFLAHGMIHDRVTGKHVHGDFDIEPGIAQESIALLNVLAKKADLYDAHLNAAKGEAVAWWCAIESVGAIDGTEEIAMSWNADDGNAGEVARTEANQWINDQPHPGNFHLAKIYTHPDSPDVVRECVWTFEEDDLWSYSTGCGNMFIFTDGTPEENDCKFCCYCGGKLIDAAMAAREGK